MPAIPGPSQLPRKPPPRSTPSRPTRPTGWTVTPVGLRRHPRIPLVNPIQPPFPPILSGPANKKPKVEPKAESRQTTTNNKAKKKPEETARLKTLVGDMRSMVECPVCLHLPRRGPIPACPNGHIICLACKEKIEERAKKAGTEAICPTCNGTLGNHTSLLAARLLEGVGHECKFTGCGEEMTLEDLEKHEKICQHQLVSCPLDQAHILSILDLRNHTTMMNCRVKVQELELNEHRLFPARMKKAHEDVNISNATITLEMKKSKQRFYLKSERVLGGMIRFEVVTEGTKEECKKNKVHIDLRDSTNSPVFTFITHPRWGII